MTNNAEMPGEIWIGNIHTPDDPTDPYRCGEFVNIPIQHWDAHYYNEDLVTPLVQALEDAKGKLWKRSHSQVFPEECMDFIREVSQALDAFRRK